MKSLILIIFLFFIFSCQKNAETKFPLLAEFNKSRSAYIVDTIELENVSVEGGELISYHNNTDQLVLDFIIYGETNKLNYTFFTNKNLDFKFAVKKNYQYNRPIDEQDMKIDSTIVYIENGSNPKLFDKFGVQIQDEKKRDSLIADMNSFLKETMKNNILIGK